MNSLYREEQDITAGPLLTLGHVQRAGLSAVSGGHSPQCPCRQRGHALLLPPVPWGAPYCLCHVPIRRSEGMTHKGPPSGVQAGCGGDDEVRRGLQGLAQDLSATWALCSLDHSGWGKRILSSPQRALGRQDSHLVPFLLLCPSLGAFPCLWIFPNASVQDLTCCESLGKLRPLSESVSSFNTFQCPLSLPQLCT